MVATGTLAGACTGFAAMCLFLLASLLVSGYRDDENRLTDAVTSLALALTAGSLAGATTGMVAGLALSPAASRLRGRPFLSRVACATAFGCAVCLPFLVAGLGWSRWPDPPLDWASIFLVTLGGVIGARKSDYILNGRTRTAAPAHGPRRTSREARTDPTGKPGRGYTAVNDGVHASRTRPLQSVFV